MKVSIHRYESDVIGLPENGQFIPVTNSGLGRLTCLRQFWFDQIEGLRGKMQGGAINRGSSWDLVIADVYEWWEATDKPYPKDGLDRCVWCGGTGSPLDKALDCRYCHRSGFGVLARAMAPWWEALEQDPAPFTEEDVLHETERIRRAFNGYVEHYEAKPLQHFRIVGVQTKLARVILNPKTGRPYRPETYLVNTSAGWIRAGTAEIAAAEASGQKIRKVSWPIYQVGALDAVACDRSSGAGWAIDAKYTGAMKGYQERLAVDPQLPGYCWLLEGNVDHFGMTGVGGMMYDLTHSRYHSDPFELKWKPPLARDMKEECLKRGIDVKGMKAPDLQRALGIEEGHGGFSMSPSKLAGVPSWILRDAIEAAGFSEDDYQEALRFCESEVDGSLYSRPWAPFGKTARDRYARESFAKARMTAALHRQAARVSAPEDVDVTFPRTPICALPGGSCSFRGICSQDSPEARDHYDRANLVTWREESPEATEAPPLSLQDELGF